MSQTIVLVTFYSRGGSTEKLATAAAVGAVQARAGIRMRRVADADPSATLERFPQWREPLSRMHKEYVPPREADILAADALIFSSPADLTASSAEWAPYFDLLSDLQSRGKLLGKVGAVVGSGSALTTLASALLQLGLIAPPPAPDGTDPDDVERAVALGRQVVSVAEAIKLP